MNTGSFFSELKRRNVYKVAVAYVLAAWALAQGVAQLLPVFDAPNWVARLVVVFLVLGFPVALAFAWVFEITPEGVKRTEEVDPTQSIRHHTGRKIVAITVGLAVVAAAITLFRIWHTSVPPQRAESKAEIPEKSIAVLPFENLSSDKENAYFAEGIQDEILTRLAKIADLKVISRTSTQHYRSTGENLSEVGRQLRVAHVVEGSVQKSGDAVRVNVQLIKAGDDSHVWGDTFDRKVTDVFLTETEIAKTIADQLGAKLTGREEQAIASKPTDVPEAYDAYLRSLSFFLQGTNNAVNMLPAQKYIREAVQLDPKFAVAWALLARIDANGYISASLERSATLCEESKHAADTALSLGPQLGEALYAQGSYHYACLKDYDTAIRYFQQARQLLPNASVVSEALAYIARRRGQWDRSNFYFTEAERLDPRNAYLLEQHALLKMALREFAEADRIMRQSAALEPANNLIKGDRAEIAQSEGDLPRAASLLADVEMSPLNPVSAQAHVRQLLFERRPAEAVARLQELLARTDPSWRSHNAEFRFSLGWAQKLSGDAAAARQTWLQARSELEALLKEQPANSFVIGDLALVCMGLRDKAAAFEFAEQGIAANPPEKDTLSGPAQTEVLARVAAQLGEPDRAIAALEYLMRIPYGGWIVVPPLTPAILRLDPMFDPLRSDPRFQKLCEQATK